MFVWNDSFNVKEFGTVQLIKAKEAMATQLRKSRLGVAITS